MARAWVFQANPDRYDIDGALAELQQIRWWVPQYTSEIRPGDVVAIWRSGPQAGIVGVGRVAAGPREAAAARSEEDRFVRQSLDQGETTVVDLRVARCAFVAKADVAAIPVLADHKIITAPMGTVFAVTEEQWQQLQSHLPEPPPVDVVDDDGWPAAFSWEQRTKSVTPLPGGIDAYVDVLSQILTHVAETEPARDELAGWIETRFEVSSRRANLVAGFLTRVGLLRSEAARIHLTAEARRWLTDHDHAYLLALIHGRVRYIGELVAYLDQPRTIEELLQHANHQYGMNWTSRGQIIRRRHLLGGLGVLDLDDEGRLVRTSFGDYVLSQLSPAAPQAPDRPTSSTQPEPSHREPTEDQRGSPAAADAGEVDRIVAQLLATAHDSTNPDAFEQATREAFAFLGFDAVWYGGAGKTDVLLTAALSAEEQYRVVIDTKTTAHAAVGDAQIDWVTIDEHQQRYDADYVAVVAPAFRGDRLSERARQGRSVALLTVTQLADVVRQHAIAPLDLDVYRQLFDPDRGAETVLDHADTLRRQLVLAAEIVRQVSHLAGEEGAVTPGDLYWNLDAFAEQFEGQRPAREEITAVCTALANPPLSLLRSSEQGYTPLGSHTTAANRLRLLAELLEHGIPEITS